MEAERARGSRYFLIMIISIIHPAQIVPGPAFRALHPLRPFCLHDNPGEWELLFCLIFQMKKPRQGECKSLLKVGHFIINVVGTWSGLSPGLSTSEVHGLSLSASLPPVRSLCWTLPICRVLTIKVQELFFTNVSSRIPSPQTPTSSSGRKSLKASLTR